MLKTIAVLCALTANVSAFSNYNDQVPNGGKFGKGLGHTGAPGPYNQFALDLKAQGNKWTAALCKQDSDKDGQTNGHELGDPCCGEGRALWTIGATPTYTNAQASNPSQAASKSALPPGCPAAGAPTPPAPVPVVIAPPTPVVIAPPTPGVVAPTPGTPTPTPIVAPTPAGPPLLQPDPTKLNCKTLACDAFGPQSVYRLPGDGSNIGCAVPINSSDKCTKSECCMDLQQVTCSAAVCGAGTKLRTPLAICFGVCDAATCCVPDGVVDSTPTGPDQCTINDDKCGVCIDNAPNCYWCNFALGGVGCTSQLAKCSVRAGTNYADVIQNKDKCPVTGGQDGTLPTPIGTTPTPVNGNPTGNPNPYNPLRPNGAASVGASLMAGVLIVALLL